MTELKEQKNQLLEDYGQALNALSELETKSAAFDRLVHDIAQRLPTEIAIKELVGIPLAEALTDFLIVQRSEWSARFTQKDVDEIVEAAKRLGAGAGLTHKMGQFCLQNYAEPHTAGVLAMLIVGAWDEKWDLIYATEALIEFLHRRSKQ